MFYSLDAVEGCCVVVKVRSKDIVVFVFFVRGFVWKFVIVWVMVLYLLVLRRFIYSWWVGNMEGFGGVICVSEVFFNLVGFLGWCSWGIILV